MPPNWRGRNFSSAGCRHWKFDLLKVAASTGRGTLAEKVTFGVAASLCRWREGERRGRSEEEGKGRGGEGNGEGLRWEGSGRQRHRG